MKRMTTEDEDKLWVYQEYRWMYRYGNSAKHGLQLAHNRCIGRYGSAPNAGYISGYGEYLSEIDRKERASK